MKTTFVFNLMSTKLSNGIDTHKYGNKEKLSLTATLCIKLYKIV